MKVFLRTFGCRANHYDTEAIRTLVIRGGAEIVSNVNEADVAVFNSCSVTADAEADLRQAIRRGARLNPHLRSIVTGCAAGRAIESGDLGSIANLTGVEAILGPGDLDALAKELNVDRDANAVLTIRQNSSRALLRIQDGCDEHCSFCMTTIARGQNRSRNEFEIVREARVLSESHREIVITGTHIGSYGTDTGTSLSNLVDRLIREIPDVRFRLSSLEATEVDDKLRELFAEPESLAPYLHAPLQSGSDRILKRMGRHWYSAKSYRERIEAILRDRPVFGLGADVMVGFPGETDADHEETMHLVEDMPFTSLHVFPYSARPGTAAPRLEKPVGSEQIRRRAAQLRLLGEKKRLEYARRRSGGVADVVVLSHGNGRDGFRKNASSGMTGDYLTVSVGGSVLPQSGRFHGWLMFQGETLHAIPVTESETE